MASVPPPSTESKKQQIKSFEAKSLRSRSFLTQIADDLTTICGSTYFLIFHVLFFVLWIAVNLGYVKEVAPFDPYPFGFLTMVVSLEAIFLSIFVLVSQNRSSYISTLRDEVHLGVNLIAEEEITKILEILVEVRKELGIKKDDPQLNKMLERINTGNIERAITGQMERATKPLMKQVMGPIKSPSTIINPNHKHSHKTVVDDDDF